MNACVFLHTLHTHCIYYVYCLGPVKAVARKPRPLCNLHSLVQLQKQFLTQLVHELRTEVSLFNVHLYFANVRYFHVPIGFRF